MRIFNRIHFRNVYGDMLGGVTAAVVSLPMALAFGVASGAGPQAGLYGAVCVGFFAALLGGTPTLISEPTGPMTVVITAVITSLVAKDPDNGLAMAFAVVVLAGVFQILFGIFKLGKYITLMPYTVISGFMTGIGVIMVILQIGPFFGHKLSGGVLSILMQIPQVITQINPAETILATLTVGMIFAMPSKYKRFMPPQLLALVVGTLLAVYLFPSIFPDISIRQIGEIPKGLPQLRLPAFSMEHLQLIAVDGIVLGVLGCIDSLLTSVVADSLTRTHHDSDKELIGQGVGNIISGLCGGLPGAGATMGTVVNIQTGARTALSGLTRAVILLIVIVWAADLTENIPMAVLAGIALKVGIDIIDWGFLKRAHEVSVKAALIMYGVIALTVFVDLIAAVGIGVFIANILTIQRLSDLQSKDVKAITDADDEILLTETEKSLMEQAQGRVLLFYLSGPMIFGVSKAIAREQAVVENYEVLILDLSDVPLLGVTSSLVIESAIKDALDKQRQVLIVGATGQARKRLEKLKILSLLGPDGLLADRETALRKAVALINPDGEAMGQESPTVMGAGVS